MANFSQRWCVWLAIEGDLRFLSHLDVMRAVERLLARAGLPVRYSQGFNPRPVFGFPIARPVGVSAEGEAMLLSLEQPIEAGDLLERLNRHAPTGLRATHAEALEAGRRARAAAVSYRLALGRERAAEVRRRLDGLAGEPCWPVERLRPAKARAKPGPPRQIDLRQLLEEIDLRGDVLRMTLKPQADTWARPAEVLRLLGLDEQVDLARTVRERIQLSISAPPGGGVEDKTCENI